MLIIYSVVDHLGLVLPCQPLSPFALPPSLPPPPPTPPPPFYHPYLFCLLSVHTASDPEIFFPSRPLHPPLLLPPPLPPPPRRWCPPSPPSDPEMLFFLPQRSAFNALTEVISDDSLINHSTFLTAAHFWAAAQDGTILCWTQMIISIHPYTFEISKDFHP